MISVFKKGTPKIVGGLGDGTRANPWYWYGKTSGQTVAVNNSNASSGDNHRVYLRVKLKGGTTYTIGQTSIGSSGDGMIWLYNSAMSEVASDDHSGGEINGLGVQDVMTYTPSADGVYIIGAGAYDSDKGDFTVAMSPAPEQETWPEVEYQYPTSSGFNALGRPLKYDTASAAGCSIKLPIPTDGLVFYAPLNKDDATAVTGQTLNYEGNVTFQTVDGVPMANFTNGYIEVDNAVPTGNNPFSVSLYAKMLGTTDDWPGLVQLSTNTSNFATLYTDPEQKCSAVAKADGQDVFNLLGISDDLTELQHLVLTYSDKDGVVRAYRNGSFVLETATSGAWQQESDMRIGRQRSAHTFPGDISAVRVYDRVLSDREIKALSKEFKI